MVSVLHKELEYNVEKLKYKKDGDQIAAEDQNQIRISPHEVLQLWLINTVHRLLVKNNNRGGEGRGGA